MKFHIPLIAAATLCACSSSDSTDGPCQRPAEEIHAEAIVIDMHDDILNRLLARRKAGAPISMGQPIPAFDSDIPRWRAGGVDAVFMPVYTSGEDSHYQKALEIHAELQHQIELNPDDLEQAMSADDIERIVAEGKIAAILALEGGHLIENRLDNLRELYGLGYRYLGLTHDTVYDPYMLGSSSFQIFDWVNPTDYPTDRDEGLNETGRAAIDESIRLGMMVDLSHASYLSKREALSQIDNRAPAILSHDAAFTLHPHYRTATDDVLDRVAQSGGFIGAYFIPHLLNRGPNDERPTIETVLDHIDYLVGRTGEDHVAVGSDYNGIPEMMQPFPAGLEDAETLPNLTAGLIQRGYSCRAIKKIWGENVLATMRRAEAARERQLR